MSRVALIHAVTIAIAPIEHAFRELWPEAERVNLLDDSLSPDRERDGTLTPAMTHRIGSLARYAKELGADGILFTCSAFGKAIEAAAATTSHPVLRPNEAMFQAALEYEGCVGMLATFPPSVESMEQEFRAMAAQRHCSTTLHTVCVPAAMAALKAGDGALHDRLLAEAAPALNNCAAVLLAHFSTARAKTAVSAAIGCPVLTSPGTAVMRLKNALQQAAM